MPIQIHFLHLAHPRCNHCCAYSCAQIGHLPTQAGNAEWASADIKQRSTVSDSADVVLCPIIWAICFAKQLHSSRAVDVRALLMQSSGCTCQ